MKLSKKNILKLKKAGFKVTPARPIKGISEMWEVSNDDRRGTLYWCDDENTWIVATYAESKTKDSKPWKWYIKQDKIPPRSIFENEVLNALGQSKRRIKRKNADDLLRKLERTADNGDRNDLLAYWQACLRAGQLPKTTELQFVQDPGDSRFDYWRLGHRNGWLMPQEEVNKVKGWQIEVPTMGFFSLVYYPYKVPELGIRYEILGDYGTISPAKAARDATILKVLKFELQSMINQVEAFEKAKEKAAED